MPQYRPQDIIAALRRLGFGSEKRLGDHVYLFKEARHPDGHVTIKTGVVFRQNPCSKHDLARIKREARLSGDMLERAIGKNLGGEEYDRHLASLPREELVPRFYRNR